MLLSFLGLCGQAPCSTVEIERGACPKFIRSISKKTVSQHPFLPDTGTRLCTHWVLEVLFTHNHAYSSATLRAEKISWLPPISPAKSSCPITLSCQAPAPAETAPSLSMLTPIPLKAVYCPQRPCMELVQVTDWNSKLNTSVYLTSSCPGLQQLTPSWQKQLFLKVYLLSQTQAGLLFFWICKCFCSLSCCMQVGLPTVLPWCWRLQL